METELKAAVTGFITKNPANLLPEGTPYFDTPLTGFAALDDPLFTSYKEIIGDFHLTPRELFLGTFGAEPANGTVICWILPIAAAVRKSNRPQLDYPSRQWALTRTHGEALNGMLRRHLCDWLTTRGYRALAPQFSPLWKELPQTPDRFLKNPGCSKIARSSHPQKDPRRRSSATPHKVAFEDGGEMAVFQRPSKGRASTWSERHAAYAAGLGTFSLNDAMITAKGIAHRCGSVITDLVLPPSPRADKGYADNCLYYRDGSCGACIGRCPVGAISFAGHDKERCCEYVYTTIPAKVGEKYGVSATGCGLCQTRVPCESGIPRGC